MRRIVFLFLLMSAFAYQSADAQCVSGDCRNGTGIFLFPSGAKYVGQFQDGKLHGIGTCYYTDGSKYQGQWQEGYPQGDGIKTFADGSQRRGKWEQGKPKEADKPVVASAESEPPSPDVVAEPASQEEEEAQTGCVSGDCRNGKGIYIYPSGAIYIGEFKDGEIHGIGVCNYSDGSKYQGNWKARYPHGKGTKTFADGTKWTGKWVQGQPVDDNGEVIVNLFPDKELAPDQIDIQTGCVEGNCEDGTGILAYADGSKYEGSFRDGHPHGQGTFSDVTGDRYVGYFRNGLRHGDGTLYLAAGDKQIGRWKEGEYIGQRQDEYGCVQGDCANGRGSFVYKDEGAKYVGAFRSNQPHGQGIMYYANGEVYSGQWEEGNFQGQGKLTLTDGTIVDGYWAGGDYVGEEKPAEDVESIRDLAEYREKQQMKVWAVVIGISSYNHMPTLRYTDDDAYKIYAFLKSPEGGALADDQIRILIDEDATRDNIVQTMNDVFMRAGENDLVMLYYSGHGLKGAFLPIDFDGFNNRLEHEEINRILEECPAKYKLCIADACHSGSLLAMKSGELGNVLGKYYESLAQADPGTALIMSSKSEETSLESSGLRQGVFSHFLIRGLKGEADSNANGIISVQELYEYVHRSVKKYTGNRQSPILEGEFDANMTVSVIRG
ncbi:MAG: peptidase C14 caspase catalytic subunit p20 [Bacteroidetes bacterium]|nr:peptidase C14 caspase catalytic subunit p20 [Bacteroidota bacterium]